VDVGIIIIITVISIYIILITMITIRIRTNAMMFSFVQNKQFVTSSLMAGGGGFVELWIRIA
jgi:hypothetical protein